MALVFHIAAQPPANASSPAPLQRDEQFVNVAFEFAQLPPVHEVIHASEVIFSAVFALGASADACDVDKEAGGFLVDTVVFFDEYTLSWHELFSAAQLRPGIQLFCLSPLQCSLLPHAQRRLSMALLELNGKQLLPAPDLLKCVRWPSSTSQHQTLVALSACMRRTAVPAFTRPAPFSSSSRPRTSSIGDPSSISASVNAADRSLYEQDAEGRTFSTRVREVFHALDREQRSFLLLRDFYDFAARYTLPPALLARHKAVQPQQPQQPQPQPQLSPFLDENLARLTSSDNESAGATGGDEADTEGAAGRLLQPLPPPPLALTRTCDFDAIVRAADSDRDGRISFTEWTVFCFSHPDVLKLFYLHLHPLSAATAATVAATTATKTWGSAARGGGVDSGARQSSEGSRSRSRRSRLTDDRGGASRTSSTTTSTLPSEAAQGDAEQAPAAAAVAALPDDATEQLPARAAPPQSERERVPRYMQGVDETHHCYFRKCAACAAKQEASAATAAAGAAAVRAGKMPAGENGRACLPWNYRADRRHTI